MQYCCFSLLITASLVLQYCFPCCLPGPSSKAAAFVISFYVPSTTAAPVANSLPVPSSTTALVVKSLSALSSIAAPDINNTSSPLAVLVL